MPTPREICEAKARAVPNGKECGFGKPNPNNPEVFFTGCPACHKSSKAGETVEHAYKDMLEFMERINESRSVDAD